MLPDISLGQALAGALVILYCSALQASVGFGFSLFAIPLLLMTLKLPLPHIVLIAMTSSMTQRCIAVYKLRRSVGWRDLAPMIAAAILALPIGLLLLKYVSGQSRDTARQCVGALVLGAMLVRLTFRPKPRRRIHRMWDLLAGFAGGVLNGFANIGGPPLVMWLYAHDWPRERLRVTVVAWSLPLTPFQAVLIVHAFGADVLKGALLSFCYLPMTGLGSWAGLTLGKKFSVRWLRTVAASLLILIGVYNLFQPLFLP